MGNETICCNGKYSMFKSFKYELIEFLQGKEAGYDILLIEPQTPWRYKPRELFK
jgi:hypothetical protein